MSWYRLQESGLTVRGNSPPESWGDMLLMVANTVYQEIKDDEDKDAQARLASQMLYEKGMMTEPVETLDEFLAQLENDGRLIDAIQMAGSLPAEEVEGPDAPMTPESLAWML